MFNPGLHCCNFNNFLRLSFAINSLKNYHFYGMMFNTSSPLGRREKERKKEREREREYACMRACVVRCHQEGDKRIVTRGGITI